MGLKILVVDKHSSLFCLTVSDEEKSFIRLTPGANPIKLFTVVIANFRNKLVFVPAKPFQPSLMFGARLEPTQVNHLSVAPRVGSWPYPQTLDKEGKAYQGQTFQHLMKIRKLGP